MPRAGSLPNGNHSKLVTPVGCKYNKCFRTGNIFCLYLQSTEGIGLSMTYYQRNIVAGLAYFGSSQVDGKVVCSTSVMKSSNCSLLMKAKVHS